MAIQRDARSVDLGSGIRAAGAAPSAVGFVAPDSAKFYDANKTPVAAPSTLDNIVSTLVKPVTQLAQTELSNAREEAYLRGQAAAGTGLAEKEVQSNIFTKDYATAGWRDTRGMLQMADLEAQTAVDMQKLREQDPAKMNEYLEERRRKLLPSLEGMSLEARKGMLGKMLMSDRAAIAKHAGEHQKFIIDTIGKGVQTSMSTQFDAMRIAKTDPVGYLTAAQSTFASLRGDVWLNQNLPVDMRIKLTTEAAAAALAQGHEVLYEQMRDTKLENGSTMLQQLPFDDQVKLQKAYDSSRKDSNSMRYANFHQQLGLMEASFNDPTQPEMSYQDFQAFLNQGVQFGLLDGSKQASLTKAWAEGNRKKAQAGELAGAYASGNVNAMFASGHDEADGYKAFIQASARSGATAADTAGRLLQIGLNTGQNSAFKGVGELARSAISVIGKVDKIDNGQLNMLNTILGTLDRAQAGGNAGAMNSFLSSFSDEERSKLMLYREGIQGGKDAVVAAADAAETMGKQSQLSDTERNILAANHAKSNQEIVNKLEPRGLWGTIKNALPDAVRFTDNVNRDKISTGKYWWENEERAAAEMMPSKLALLEELNYTSRSDPFASDASRERIALAKVAERTLVLKDGPLVLPRMFKGQTAQDFFGVDRQVAPETIASVLSEKYKAKDGNRMSMKINGQSQLQWSEYGKDGQLVGSGTVNPKEIAGDVRERNDKLTDFFNRTDGAGVTRKGDTGAQVTYNGNNTALVPTTLMAQFRDNLFKHEQVRDTPYEDASGKVVDGKRVMTAGVGVSSHNPFYPKDIKDGKLTQKQINDSFMMASNAAAITGRDAQRAAGLDNTSGFKLMAEMSYQGGSVSDDFIKAVQSKDINTAMAALKATPQYKWSHDARKKSYEDLLTQSLTMRK